MRPALIIDHQVTRNWISSAKSRSQNSGLGGMSQNRSQGKSGAVAIPTRKGRNKVLRSPIAEPDGRTDPVVRLIKIAPYDCLRLRLSTELAIFRPSHLGVQTPRY